MLAVALAALNAGAESNDILNSVRSEQLYRQDSRLQARSDIADLLDKNPNIKALVADYSDLIEPLIQRDTDDSSVRDIEQLDLARLRLRSIIRRAAEARAEADADAEAEGETEGGEVLLAIAERNADPEAEPDAEANIFTGVFGTNLNDASKNSKRDAEAQLVYEPQANIFTRMFKTGSDLLSGINSITRRNKKRDPNAEPEPKSKEYQTKIAREAETEAGPEAEAQYGFNADSLKYLFSRGFDFIGEYSGVGVGNHQSKRDPTAVAEPEAAYQEIFERSPGHEI